MRHIDAAVYRRLIDYCGVDQLHQRRFSHFFFYEILVAASVECSYRIVEVASKKFLCYVLLAPPRKW